MLVQISIESTTFFFLYFIFSLTGHNIPGAFIGLRLLNDTGSQSEPVWTWVDRSPMEYRNWHDGEPTKYYKGILEDCVVLYYSKGAYMWNAAPCSFKFGYICEKKLF